MIITFYSLQTGEPCQSFYPWPPVQTRGGGAVKPCQYHISINNANDLDGVLSKIRDAIDQMAEKIALTVTTL
jgi:hypothetical protein